MKATLKIPRISMNMQEATLRKWFKQPGESFEQGEALYEIETEKVVNEVEAPAKGTLLEIMIEEDSECEVGDPVCRIQTE